MVATFVAEHFAITVARDSIEKPAEIKVVALVAWFAKFDFATTVVAKRVVANKVVVNEVVANKVAVNKVVANEVGADEVVVIAIAIVMMTMAGYKVLLV